MAKCLEKEIWKERYQHKKALRAAEDAAEDASKAAEAFSLQAKDKEQRVREHEEEISKLKQNVKNINCKLTEERNKKKADVLAEHREDIRRLQQTKLDKKSSIERWETRSLACMH